MGCGGIVFVNSPNGPGKEPTCESGRVEPGGPEVQTRGQLVKQVVAEV